MKYLVSLFLWLTILLFMAPRSYAQQATAMALGDFGNVTVMEVTGNYDVKNPEPPLPGQLPAGYSYVQGHVAWP
jgi:hypothetical protein